MVLPALRWTVPMGEPLPGPYEEGSGPFSAEFWEMLAPRLTSLVLVLADPEPDIVDIPLAWLSQMQKLQILELEGCGDEPRLELPPKLVLIALKELVLQSIGFGNPCRLECPMLEQLRFRFASTSHFFTGLDACSHLSVIDVAKDPGYNRIRKAHLFASVEMVQATLEALDISGWGLESLPGWFATLRRLHTLRAADNRLKELPALPVSLKVLDLGGNSFAEVPVELESLSSLTSLTLSPKMAIRANFQITRDLGPIIGLPDLQRLALAPCNVFPPSGFWNARSLSFLRLAQHEIAESGTGLKMSF